MIFTLWFLTSHAFSKNSDGVRPWFFLVLFFRCAHRVQRRKMQYIGRWEHAFSTKVWKRVSLRRYLSVPEKTQKYQAPTTLSLISTTVVTFKSGAFKADPLWSGDENYMAFPHLNFDDNPVLYSTLNSNNINNHRALVRSSGVPWWPRHDVRTTVVLYVKE